VIVVDRDRDGRSYSARHVNAMQSGEVIFSGLASFHVPETGVDHQEPPLDPTAGDPERLPERPRVGHNVLLDIRGPERDDPASAPSFWARVRGPMTDDPVLAACVLTYMSDVGWAFGDLPAADGIGGPSLDHAIWLQRPVDAAGWVHVDLHPVTLAGARGVFTGTMHDRAGRLVAHVAQEAVLRPRS
jgi:acyl-CoA thioesterase-2